MEEDLLARALDSVSAAASDKHLLNIIQCGASERATVAQLTNQPD